MRRRPLKMKTSKRVFRKTAMRMHKKNRPPRRGIMRGGMRF